MEWRTFQPARNQEPYMCGFMIWEVLINCSSFFFFFFYCVLGKKIYSSKEIYVAYLVYSPAKVNAFNFIISFISPSVLNHFGDSWTIKLFTIPVPFKKVEKSNTITLFTENVSLAKKKKYQSHAVPFPADTVGQYCTDHEVLPSNR